MRYQTSFEHQKTTLADGSLGASPGEDNHTSKSTSFGGSTDSGNSDFSSNSNISQNTNIEKSSKPYQGSILGIISTKPGVRLSTSEESLRLRSGPPSEVSSRPVALNGRVPVKVSTKMELLKLETF